MYTPNTILAFRSVKRSTQNDIINKIKSSRIFNFPSRIRKLCSFIGSKDYQ